MHLIQDGVNSDSTMSRSDWKLVFPLFPFPSIPTNTNAAVPRTHLQTPLGAPYSALSCSACSPISTFRLEWDRKDLWRSVSQKAEWKRGSPLPKAWLSSSIRKFIEKQ